MRSRNSKQVEEEMKTRQAGRQARQVDEVTEKYFPGKMMGRRFLRSLLAERSIRIALDSTAFDSLAIIKAKIPPARSQPKGID